MIPFITSLFSILATPLSTAGGMVSDYFAHKMKMTELTRQAELAQAQAQTVADGDADAATAQANKTSWVGKFITIIVTMPYVGCFIPCMAPYIQAGFKILESTTPQWYVGLFTVVCLADIGARGYIKMFAGPKGPLTKP